MPGATSRGYEYPTAGDEVGDLPAKVQELAETVDAQLKRIESGAAQTTSLATGNGQDVNVAFGAAFAAAPRVLTTILNNRNDPYAQTILVKAVTTTGFTVRIHNTSGITLVIPFAWLAHG